MVRAEPRWEATPSDRAEDLLKLAEHLQTILLPVQPNASFRQRLHSDLDRDARYRQRNAKTSLFQQHRIGILIGAAAIGSAASVLSVAILYLLRHRHRTVTQVTAGL
jgi:hypothetical protein